MPFGVKVAPGIFKQIMDTLLNDIDFAIAYLDDIKSESQEQYVKHVKDVFEKIEQRFETLKIFKNKKNMYLSEMINAKKVEIQIHRG